MAKDDGKKKKPKGKKKKGGEEGSSISVAGHPRARAQVRRAKGWGGLIGFVLGGYLSLQAGVPLANSGLRAILAGIGGYMIAWGVSVTIWRQLVLAEIRTAADAAAEAHKARAEAAAARAIPQNGPGAS
jgi:hypothetical protein